LKRKVSTDKFRNWCTKHTSLERRGNKVSKKS